MAIIPRKNKFSEEQPLDTRLIETIDVHSYRSNPALSAENRPLQSKKGNFLPDLKSEWQRMAVRYPYKEARLIHFDGDLSKRWFIIFYAFDVSEEKLKRVRLFKPLNDFHTVRERLDTAEQMIRDINTDLRAGKVLGKTKIQKSIDDISKKTVDHAIQYFITEKNANKNSINYTRKFVTLKARFEAWAKEERIDGIKVRELTLDLVLQFFNYMRDKCKSNKTYNNYRSDFAIFMNFVNKRKPGTFKFNLVDHIDKLPVVVKRHAAYSDAQVKMIIEYCRKKYPQLTLYIQFIYYTLARPKQLLSLKVNDIDLDGNRIFLDGRVDKNKRDSYVSISPGFKSIIQKSGIMKYPGDLYIFGIKGVPGEHHFKRVLNLYNRHRKVLDALKLRDVNENFSLYSYKHSGAISLYKATKDIKLVQRQCRHKTLEQTNAYLRDLDVLTDHDALKGWKGAA